MNWTAPPARDGAEGAAPDLSPFGLELPDEEWLALLGRANRPAHLGSVGDYELLDEVGRGAQGIVYRAKERKHGRVVAVKRLLAGSFATRAAQSRFAREMEVAATLRHPNIVRVDTVLHADGAPLLVMEWIDGVPVDRWADGPLRGGTSARVRSPADGALSPRQTRCAGGVRTRGDGVGAVLEVFLKICDAVHHAHQRGVIHRDLKPSNILVDECAGPHLLDFGLAKVIHPENLLRSTLTGSGDFLGTPAYAAPEQVRGDHEAVDVRTDVYALGVLLFRVLTGSLPFHAAANLPDLLNAIQHAAPARASAVNRRVDDELDAVIEKALAKDAGRRYASVDALAGDVRRFLAGDPVDAKRGRRAYLLRKALWKHRTAVGVAVLLFVLVSSASLALTAMYVRQSRLLAQVTMARDAESRARQGAQHQQEVLQSLLAAAAGIGKGADVGVRRAWLDEATRLVETRLDKDPEAQAAAYDAIGRTYESLALYPEAERHLRAALSLRRSVHREAHPDLARSLSHVGELLQDCNRFGEAEPFLRESLAMRQRLFTGDHPDVAASLNGVGLILQYRNEYRAAEALHTQALEMYERLGADQSAEYAFSLNQIGNALANRADYSSAVSYYRPALEIHTELYGAMHRETAASQVSLAKSFFQLGEYDDAESLYRQAVGTFRELLGDGHDNLAWGLHRLGVLLHARGQYAEADAALRESLGIYRRCFGDQDPFVALVLDSLGTLLLDRGDLDGARLSFEEALAIREQGTDVDDNAPTWHLNRLAEWHERAGDYETAEPALRKIVEDGEGGRGVEYPYWLRTQSSLGRLLLATGRADEAEAAYSDVLAMRRARLGARHPDVGRSLVDLGTALAAQGRIAEAETHVRAGIELLRGRLSPDHPELARGLLEAASIAEALGDPTQADTARQEALAIQRRRASGPP